MADYEVIKVGGGLGGAALAKVLAASGLRVLVLERSKNSVIEYGENSSSRGAGPKHKSSDSTTCSWQAVRTSNHIGTCWAIPFGLERHDAAETAWAHVLSPGHAGGCHRGGEARRRASMVRSNS
jgi:choline dehydrogenase-like flavoprotein